jgi:hypothetical protein
VSTKKEPDNGGWETYMDVDEVFITNIDDEENI